MSSSLSSGFKPGPSGSGVPASGNMAVGLLRREGEILYDCWTKPYSASVKVNGDLWSPPKLKLLAAESLRREHFVAEFAEEGGVKNFRSGGKFNAAVLRAITEQPYFGFLARVNTWLRSTPRARYPALPELPRRGNEWSVQDVVRNHVYYVQTPDHSGNAPGNPAGDDSDSSVEISPVKRISH